MQRPVTVALLMAAFIALSAGPARAADAAEVADPPAVHAAAGEQSGRDQDGARDPCRGRDRGRTARLDRLRQGVFNSVCSSSRWFDGLFGDERNYSESYDQTYGRLGVGFAWDERDDFSFDGHFRASVQLPALGDRFNAVVGRETEETYLDDNFDDVGFLPGSFSDDQDARWYAGINYNAIEGTNSRFDVSAGLQVKSPLNPYIKARYRYYLHASDKLLLTVRATPFWENINGFGVTLAVDSDWSIADRQLLRWANTLTRSQTTDGVRWKSRLAFYQALSGASAMRYEASVRGETSGIEPDLRELKVTYRRSMWRKWFFLETYGGVFWADDQNPARVCDACAMAGVGFEMMFGERYAGHPTPAADDPP